MLVMQGKKTLSLAPAVIISIREFLHIYKKAEKAFKDFWRPKYIKSYINIVWNSMASSKLISKALALCSPHSNSLPKEPKAPDV